jgi:hypothetical protein
MHGGQSIAPHRIDLLQSWAWFLQRLLKNPRALATKVPVLEFENVPLVFHQ